MIYHYTSAEALMSIVPENGIHLRFSRYDCLNDANEGCETLRIQNKICEELIKRNTEQQFVESTKKIAKVTPQFNALIVPECGKTETGSMKNGKLSLEASITVYNSETIPYICCSSKSEDSLPMWNYYVKGQRYEGYNIGIDIKKDTAQILDDSMEIVENTGIRRSWLEVVYEEDKKKR